MHKLIYILIIMLLPVLSFAQEGGHVEIFGKTTDATQNRRMGGVEVVIYKDGSMYSNKMSASNGKFEDKFPIGSSYKIEFKKPGYVSKFITIDLSSVNEEDFGKYNLPMELDMSLFQMVDDVDFSLLENNPIGKAQWDPQAGTVQFDWSYTEKMKKQIDKLMKEVEQKQEENNEKKEQFDQLMQQGNDAAGGGDFKRALSNYQEAKSVFPEGEGADEKIAEMQQKIKEQEEAGQQYDKLISQGDQAFNSGDYDKALEAYNQAIILKPDEKYPSDQIIKIEEKKAELEKQKEAEAQKEQEYQNLITAADNLLNQKEYEKALEKYEEASNVKPTETYPKTKMAEIEGLLADAKKNEELEAKYNKLIQDGDAKLGSKEYKSALGKYQEASTLKPDEQYPKDKIAEINTILKKEKEAEELQRAYDEAIQKGDQFFTQEEYESAKSQFQKASELKPEEQYPKDKIAEIEKKIKELAANKEQQDKYDAIIQAADNKFNSESWDEAKTKYEEALTVFPNKPYPKEQIAAIEKKKKEIADKKALEEKFNNLVAEADQLFDSEDWEQSKEKYNAALEIKADHTHSKTRIMEINEKLRSLANQEELEEQYKAFIAKADAAYQSKDYTEAKKQYEEALGVKPNESYPKTQLQAIEDAIAKQKEEELEKQYQELVAAGDKAFDSESYTEAKEKYNAALELKSTESYPKDKIRAIDDLLAKKAENKEAQEQLEKDYEAAIKEADQLFADQQWENSIKKYQKALDLKPDESHPKARIEEANQKIKEAKAENEVDANYQAEIDKADAAFDNENYEESKNLYKKAAQIKPGETYPQEQIDKINELMKEETNEQIEEQYIKIINKADSYFNGTDYDNAEVYYKRALSIKPDDQYPNDKLNEIAQIRKNSAKNEVDAEYNKVILEADAMFEQKEWKRAKELYKKAYKIKVNPYPQEQIDKINEAMKQETSSQKNEMYQKIIDKADGLFADESYEDARSYYVRAKNLMPSDSYPKSKITEIDDILAKKAQQKQGIEMANYGDPVKDQTIMDGEALLHEAEAYRKHKTAMGVKEKGETHASNLSGWDSSQGEKSKDMRDSTEMMRDYMRENNEDLGLIREKNEYDVGSYEVKRGEQKTEWSRYDESDMHKTRKQSEKITEDMELAKVGNDEPRKENELKVEENSEKIGSEKTRYTEESYDATYDSRIKTEETRDEISENNKDSDLDRQQNELDVTAFNETIIGTETEDENKSYDTRIEMRDQAETTRDQIKENNEGSDNKRIDNSEELIVYNDDRTRKEQEQSADDYDEIIETTNEANQVKEVIAENNKESDKGREKNSDDVINEQDNITEKKSEIGDESYNSITKVRDEVEETRTKIDESNNDADNTRQNNNAVVVKYDDENKKKSRDMSATDDDQMYYNRDQAEDMKTTISENNEKMGGLVDQNDEELEELEDQSKDYKKEVNEKANDRQNNSFDLMDDNYRSYDPNKFDAEFANALAKEYPAGVTEKSYNITNDEGLVTKVVTRRIVVVGSRGDVYERIQTRFGLSYFKNGGAISEYVWQSETNDATLTRHTD